jgi:hypothetical protein
VLSRDIGERERKGGAGSFSSLAASFAERAAGDKVSSAGAAEVRSFASPGSDVDCHRGADTTPAADTFLCQSFPVFER